MPIDEEPRSQREPPMVGFVQFWDGETWSRIGPSAKHLKQTVEVYRFVRIILGKRQFEEPIAEWRDGTRLCGANFMGPKWMGGCELRRGMLRCDREHGHDGEHGSSASRLPIREDFTDEKDWVRWRESCPDVAGTLAGTLRGT